MDVTVYLLDLGIFSIKFTALKIRRLILINNFNMCTTFTFLSKLKLTNGYYLLILSLQNPAGFYLLALKSKKASGGASPH